MARVLEVAAVVIACGLAGCGEGAEEGTGSADATSFGTTLTSAGDKPLTIKLQLLDGKQAKTKNQRFTKATVSRAGKSFSAFCSIAGELGTSARTTQLECGEYAETVSNDDDESFSFTVERERAGETSTFTLVSVDYSGDGTIFGEQVGILTGSDDIDTSGFEPVPLTAKLGKGTTKDPFAFADLVDEGAEGVLGKPVLSHEVDQTLPVRSLAYRTSPEMELDVTVRLTKSGSVEVSMPESVSLLKTKGQLSSGYATAATVRNRILDVLENLPLEVTQEECDVLDDTVTDCTDGGADVADCIPAEPAERAVAEACCAEYELGFCGSL